MATVGAVLGEILGSDRGIGYLVLNASRRLDGELLFATLVVLVTISLLLVAAVDLVEWAVLGRRLRAQ